MTTVVSVAQGGTGANSASLARTALGVPPSAAYDQANTARDQANTAYGQANNSYSSANLAYAQANAGYAQANSAYSQANSAYGAANTRLSASGGTLSGDLIITGNLTVSGNSTTLNTEVLTVEDADVVLLSNVASTPALNAGVIVNRGTSTNTFLRWDEVTDKWGWSDDGSTTYKFTSALDAYAQANSAYGAANNRVLKAGDTMTGQLNISSGGLLVTGNVGIGTASAEYTLDLLSSTAGYIARFKSSGNYGGVLADAGSSGSAGGGYFAVAKNGSRSGLIGVSGSYLGDSSTDLTISSESGKNIKFYTNGSSTLSVTINTSGNVGIGTATPGYILSTSSSVHGQYSQHRQSSGTGVGQEMYYMFNDSSGAAVNYASIYTEIAANTAGSHTGKLALRTVTAGTLSTKLLVDQTGNVGIGTASPLSLLYLQASAPDLIVNGTDAASTYGVKIRYSGSTTHGLHLTYFPNSAVSYIDNTYQANAGTPYGDIYFRHNVAGTMTTRMTLKADGGYIGISTTTPYTYLHVNGAYASPQALIGSSGNNGIFFHSQGGATHTNWVLGQQRTISGFEITPSTAAGGTTFSTPAFVILSSNQNVGVGTTSPTGKLTVASAAGEVHRSIELIQAGGDTTALKVGVARFGSLDGSDYADMLNNSWWDGGQWNADNASYAGMLYRLDNATTVGDAAYRWYIASPAATHSYNEYMTLNTTGLGIGTASPFSKLQVGSHTFSGGNGVYADSRAGITLHGALTSIMYASTYNDSTHPDYGLVFVHGPNTSNYNVWSLSPDGPAKGNSLNFIYGSNATNIHTGTPKVVFRGDGNVGIGTTSPSGKLHLYDSGNSLLFIEGGAGYEAGIWFRENGVNKWQIYKRANPDDLNFYSSDLTASVMTLAAAGGVGIGTLTPGSYKLNVQGDQYISGTLTEASSIVLKENIDPISNALDTISKLVGVTYDRKDGSAKNRAGLIAEEVEQVLPNVVNKDEEGNPTGIQYTNLIAYLVESIKELKAEIDVLKSK